MSRRLVALFIGTAVALGACSSDASESSDRRSGDDPAPSQTTVQATPGPGVSDSGTGRLIVSGAGSHALVELMKIRIAVYRAPDPARVDNYLSPECACYEAERRAVAELQENGWRWVTPVLQVVGLRVDEESPDRAVVTIVATRPGERVEDAGTALVRPQGPGLAPTGFRVVVARRDSAWKIIEFAAAELAPETIDEILRRGLPGA